MDYRKFLQRVAGWEDEEFVEKFPHPFLLEVTEGSLRRIYRLHSPDGDPLVVGRGRRCHVRIVETSVSTKHAEIVPPDDKQRSWRIYDRGSSNGTFLRGFAIGANVETLDNGTVIDFGPNTKFEFINARSLLKRMPPLDTISRQEDYDRGTSKIESDSSTHIGFDTTKFNRKDLEREPEEGAYHGELLLFCEGLEPISLRVGQTLTVGRSPQADLQLPDSEVSRKHAEFKRDKEGVWVRDRNSANGTRLSGRALGEEWTRLARNKIVTIGPFELYIGGPQSSTQIIAMPPKVP